MCASLAVLYLGPPVTVFSRRVIQEMLQRWFGNRWIERFQVDIMEGFVPGPSSIPLLIFHPLDFAHSLEGMFPGEAMSRASTHFHFIPDFRNKYA